MASKEKGDVIRRSSRGRTGGDVKAKTDSGCFVDDELEKQTQGEKSPPAKKDVKFKRKVQDTNFIHFDSSKGNTPNLREGDRNSVPQDVVGGGEMSRVNESSENAQIQDDLQGGLDYKCSVENTEPREDFYCLYYNDSPDESLTRRKEKRPYLSSGYDQDDEDLGARAEELLEKLKEGALKRSPKASDVEVPQFRFENKGPPIAPKPKRSSKQKSNSNVNCKDPILDELEKLGSTVGRDFTTVQADENDVSLLSDAVKELHVAQTPEECVDRFEAVQTALLENIPDTLERSKSKSKKDMPRRKSFPEVSKTSKLSSESKKSEDKRSSFDAKNKTNGKKAESPKPGKKKFEPMKFSRSEVQSLNSMKKDSHHKRSHLNDGTKPVPTRSDPNKPSKPDVFKRLSQRSESNKTNVKKDQKVTSTKGGKSSSKKPNASSGSKDVASVSDKVVVTKRSERLELRSCRRRISGDLSSIPENAVMDDKNKRRSSGEVIPLAKGEEDLSSEDNDDDYMNDDKVNVNESLSVSSFEEENVKRSPDLSLTSIEGVNGLPPTSAHFTPTRKCIVSEKATSSTTRTTEVLDNMAFPLNLSREDNTCVTSDRVKENKGSAGYTQNSRNLQKRLSYQSGRLYNTRVREQHLSDGWTSESTAGYSSECSASDADDEGDKQAELELTESLQLYEDPEDIVDMTFGAQMDEQTGREEDYIYVEEPSFVDTRDSAPMYVYSQGTQEQQLESNDFAFQGAPYLKDADGTDVYEYYEDADEEAYQRPDKSKSIYPCVDPRVQRQTLTRQTVDEHVHSSAPQKVKKFQQEKGPDPSGFMTVQDIQRLIFQGAKPSIPRSTSFCGIPSSPTWRTSQEKESLQRRSWSGYDVQQQHEPGIDPLVRSFPQNPQKTLSSQRLPKGQLIKSPYVRTVSQRSKPQFGYYSDTQLNAVNEEEERVLEHSRSFRRTPLQRRAYSLETYHSDNSISDDMNSQFAQRRPTRSHVLSRSASDCSSDYSQTDKRQHIRQLQRTIEHPNSNIRSPIPQFIDAEELAEIVSPRSTYANNRGNLVTSQQQYANSHVPQYQKAQQNQRSCTSSFLRQSSENLRIQALRRASQISSDGEADVYVNEGPSERSNLEPSSQQLNSRVELKTDNRKQKPLSEIFSDVPQRVSFEELAEKFNLGSDSDSNSEDDIDYGSIDETPDMDFGADLEFDNGDYFDDKNMIVGEAMRLKKVLGSVAERDPELEIIVTATTDPKVLPPKSVHDPTFSENSYKQTSEALVFERPPPYYEIRRKTSETSGSESSSITPVFDVPASYESETESYTDSIKKEENLRVALPHEKARHLQVFEKRDSKTQTNGEQQAAEKAISAEELLKLLLSASQGNLEQIKSPPTSQSKCQQVVQNLYFPKPQTKAASTGNIHSEETFPGHVSQLYGNSDLHSVESSLNRRRQPPPPTYHKSHESIRNKEKLNKKCDVLQAKMISSEHERKKQSSGSSRRVFEEEVDCMKTKDGFFSSGDISTSGSSIDDVGERKDNVACVSFIGCEETKEIETLPRVKLSSQRKRRKAKTGYLSDQDIPTAVKNGSDSNARFKKSAEDFIGEYMCTKQSTEVEKTRGVNSQQRNGQSFRQESVWSEKKDLQNMKAQNRPEVIDLHYYNGNDSKSYERSEQGDHEFPHDNLPSPNSLNVFIDYNKKNVMKVTTSTPKFHHAKLITQIPQGISPVPSEEEKPRSSHENGSSFGEEEFPPKYETSPPSDRSSSVYSSDDDKFFGSSDTVVFVDKSTEHSSVKPNVDNATFTNEDQAASTSNGNHSDEAARAEAYSARVDCLLQEVRSSLDLDSIGSDLLDQAMERVKDKMSPRSSQNQGTGGLTMEAYVALHQADELQAIINEIKGELWILQEENTLLKEKVVSLQHGEACSSSESTEDSLTESAERIDSIRRQIAAVVASRKKAAESDENELITVDVFLRGFGNAVGRRHPKKTDVKLGTVKVKGGANWSGVYDAAKHTFLDHVKRIDPCSCLGLGPTSMYGAQIGATMLTPETLRRKNPRVEISRKFNSCVIQLKNGMTETFDSLVYDSLIPKPVVENFVHQILENRFIVLCGAAGLGKTFLATKIAEHLAQRFGSKNESAVLTLSVGQTTRKELKKTLANLMKCDISRPSDGVPVVVVLDQLDCLASLADIFDPKQLEGNRNSPFIIGVRNKSKKGPFSSKDLAVYKYFRWIQMSVHDRHVLGLLERFLRRKLSWTDNAENEEDLLDLFLWLTHVWQRINQILQSYVDIEVTIGPSVFYSCPMDIHAAEGWFANVWNYTIIPYLHQNLRNSKKIYERNVPWEDPTKWVIMRWPWSRDRSKVLGTLKKLRQVDIVLNRNHMESTKGPSKGSHTKTRKLLSSKNQSPSKAGSLESWSTVDWDSVSLTSEVESIASSTL